MSIVFDVLPEATRTAHFTGEATGWVQEILEKTAPGSTSWARLPRKYGNRGSAYSYARTVNKGSGAWAKGAPWQAQVRRDGDFWWVWVQPTVIV